jgi:hypothetical protein
MTHYILSSIILTSSVLVQVVGLKSLPHLNWLINIIINGLIIPQDSVESLKIIMIVSLGKVIESMPNFISPHLEQIIRVLCQFDVKVTSELSKRVIKVIEIVASTSSRVLLPSISSVYSGMKSANIFTLLILVDKLIEKIKKTEGMTHPPY